MFAAIAALPPTAGKLYDPVTDLPAANRAGAALFDFNHTASQTITDGKVAQINDRFGNGFSALQSTADSRPASSANGMGSLTTASFDGVNDHIEIVSTINPLNGKYSSYLSCLITNVPSFQGILSKDPGSGSARYDLFYTSNFIRTLYGNVIFQTSFNFEKLISSELNSAETNRAKIRLDGALYISTALFSPTSNEAPFYIGRSGSYYSSMHAADILVTPSILADLDRIDYEGWQAQRGSNLAANLPATHRYRYQHPRTRTPK